eukprot:7676156-Heterocapsa_arctica.AAC.1
MLGLRSFSLVSPRRIRSRRFLACVAIDARAFGRASYADGRSSTSCVAPMLAPPMASLQEVRAGLRGHGRG